jgi:carboxymethylenebutenolidase
MSINHYVAVPEGGSGPGVLVLHAWWGLTDFFKDVCNRLAEHGFVALAPDLFNGATTSDQDEAEELAAPLFNDLDATASNMKSALEALQAHDAVSGEQVGILGYSLGAFWALDLAINQPSPNVKAVVVYYGNRPGIEPEQFTKPKAAFLGHFATDDDFKPFDDILQTQKQLEQAGKSVTFHQYSGTQHWFAESNQPDYHHAEAADLALTRTLEFLKQTLI